MKTSIYIIALLCTAALLFQACDDMHDTHKEYVDTNEILYLTKADSVIFYPGENRGQISLQLKNAVKVDDLVVYWNSENDSLVVPVTPSSGRDTVFIDLPELPEAAYQFIIKSKDKKGHTSVPVQAFGVTYGEKYRSTLHNRLFKSCKVKPYVTAIELLSVEENAVGFELEFTNNADETIMLTPDLTTNNLNLENAKPDTKIRYRMRYHPEELAIDSFYTDWEEMLLVLPAEFLVDKSKIEEVQLANDNRGRSWGGSIDKLFDNVVDANNFYHTGQHGEKDKTPLTFTIKVEEPTKFTRIKVDNRPGQAKRMPKNMEIWATNTIEGAETELHCDNAGWEEESISKGWTKIAEYRDGEEVSSFEIQLAEDVEAYQYVRFKVENVVDNSSMLNLGEITLWGKY